MTKLVLKEQPIEAEILQELESKTPVAQTLETSSKLISPSLREFFKKFLEIDFPKGQLNSVVEKNLAIFIHHNKLDLSTVEARYTAKGWDLNGLKGWLKKAENGEIPNLNILELLDWSNKNNKIHNDLLEKAKDELQQSLTLLTDSELRNFKNAETGVWIVERFVGSKKIVALTGKRSTMKSWLAMDLAYSIASGSKFLENLSTSQCNVLYLDRENDAQELKNRAAMIKAGRNLSDLANLFFLTESGLSLDNTTGQELLKEIIQMYNIQVVVLDTYRRFVSFDENDSNLVSWFFNYVLKPICYRLNVSFVLIHHSKKGESDDEMDMIRGSSDFANNCDAIFQIYRKGNTITVKNSKLRGAAEQGPFSVEAKFTENSIKFQFLGAAEQDTAQKTAQILTDWIISNNLKQFRYTQGLKYLTDNKLGSKNAYCAALDELLSKGLISQAGLRAPYIVADLAKDSQLGDVQSE